MQNRIEAATAKEGEKLQANLDEGVAFATSGAAGRVVVRPTEQYESPAFRKAKPFVGGGIIAVRAGLSLYWFTRSEDLPVLLRWFALFFALAGYILLFRRNGFIVDANAGTWERESGVWPFVVRGRGPLSALAGLESTRLTREYAHQGGSTYTDVWAVRVLWRDAARAPLEFRAFDIPAAAAGRAPVLEQHSLLAQAMGLRLVDGLASPIVPLAEDGPAPTPLPAEPNTQRPTPNALPLRPADSRISVSPLPEGGAEITFARPFSWAYLLPFVMFALFPVGFIVMAEMQHRAFLQSVSPASREFFERSPSSALFFLPFLFFIWAMAGGFGYVFYRYLTATRRLTLTPDALTISGGKPGSAAPERRLEWGDLSSVRSLNPQAASASVGGMGMDVTFQSAASGSGDYVVYGPSAADVNVGGSELAPADWQWLGTLLRGAINPETRAEFLQESVRPPSETPAPKERGGIALKANRVPLAFAAAAGVTLLNSYAGGLTLSESWRDADGNRFVRANSFWKSHTVRIDAKGNVAEASGSYTPFSSSTSGSVPATEGFVTDDYSRLTLAASAEADIAAARRDAEGIKREAAASGRRQQGEAADAAAKNTPDNASAAQFNATGDKYQMAGQWDKAEGYFRRALRAHPTPDEAYYACVSIATVSYAREDRAGALAILHTGATLSGLNDVQRKDITRNLARIEGSRDTLHHLFLSHPGDRFPGESP